MAWSDGRNLHGLDAEERRELRSARRLVRQLRLEVSDPDKAAKYDIERRRTEIYEAVAAKLGVSVNMARRYVNGSVGVPDPDVYRQERVVRIPTFGWHAISKQGPLGGSKMHLVTEWIVNIEPGWRAVKFATVCSRELWPSSINEAADDLDFASSSGLFSIFCSWCQNGEEPALAEFIREIAA